MPKLCPVCGATFADANVFCPKDGSTLRAAELDSDLIGTVIADRYLVTDLLGEGGMGKVYLARHVRLPQQAAIKVLRPAMLRDPAAIARFNREAANASSIEHEHIARVFDYGESADGTVYLAMEYVPGRTLKKILATDGPQSPERTARLTRQIGDALDAAHKMGIVHRDLKPDNVMVIEPADGEDRVDRCKVVDFGIAKAVGGDGGDAGLTKTGFVVGTPEFMSPEQLMGAAIDHRSDVYALALLAFQCLTGELPFDSSTPERTMTARLVDPPRTLASVKPEVVWPSALQAVLDRGLARDPQQRFESAGRFARELQQAVASWGGDTTVVPQPRASAARAEVAQSARADQHTQAAQPMPPAPRSSQPDSVPHPERVHAAGTSAAKSRGVMVTVGVVGLVVVSAAVWAFASGRGGGRDAALSTGEANAQIVSRSPAQGAGNVAPLPTDSAPTARTTVVPPLQDGRMAVDRQADNQRSKAAVSDQSRSTDPDLVRPTPEREIPPSASTRPRETSSAAKFTLDSIRIALNPATATDTEARRAVAALRDLMPRLATAEDSAWAYLRQAEAHFLMADELSACVAVKAARPLVRDAAQQRVLGTFTASITVRC